MKRVNRKQVQSRNHIDVFEGIERMIQKKFLTLTLLSLLTISGCSVLGTKKVEVVSKPIQLDIIQPTLPRELDLTPPQWYVVSELL